MKIFTFLSVVITICAILVMLPGLDSVTAQSDDLLYDDWEDCVATETEAFCRRLGFRPPWEEEEPTPANTPTPTHTPTPDDLLYDDWEDCIATETEAFCRRLGFRPPWEEEEPTPTNTPTPTHTPTPDDLLYDDWEDCIATETEAFCRRLGFRPPWEAEEPTPTFTPTVPPTPTNTPTDTVVPTPTDTVVPTPTDTVVPTPTDTVVPTPTDTVVPTPTNTAVIPPTPTNTAVIPPTPTNTAVIPPTPTNTPTHTPTPIDTPTPTPVSLPPAPAPNVLSIGPTDVDEVLLRWNTIYNPVATQYRVDRYRVRIREILEVGELPWTTLNSGILPPHPPRNGATAEYIADGIWDCEKDYEFEISGRGDGRTYDSNRFGNAAVVTGASACPRSLGHQRDNTIAWTEGTYPRQNPSSLPEHMEDPYTVFTTGIAPGASAWNGIAVVTVCKDGCGSNNDTIITVSKGGADKCGDSSACFEPTYSGTSQGRSGNRARHILGGTVYFEYPGEREGKDVYWTTNSSLMDDPVPGREDEAVYIYINAISVHEFGHAVGIADIVTNSSIFGVMEMNMRDPYRYHTPTSADRKHARAIYHGHASHGAYNNN